MRIVDTRNIVERARERAQVGTFATRDTARILARNRAVARYLSTPRHALRVWDCAVSQFRRGYRAPFELRESLIAAEWQCAAVRCGIAATVRDVDTPREVSGWYTWEATWRHAQRCALR